MRDSQDIEKKSLREARRAYRLTQTELAKMIGLRQMHISLVELAELTFLPHQRAAIEAVIGPIDWDERYAKLRNREKISG